MDKVIIFDFDGVLADSFSTVYEINRRAAEYLGRDLSQSTYRDLFKGNIHENLKGSLDLNTEEAQKFNQYKFSIFDSLYNAENVSLFEFAPELITQLSNNAELRIVSSAPEKAISAVLENNGILQYFSSISGINKLGKKVTFREMLEGDVAKGLSPKYFFITDTVGDIREALGFPIKTVGVGWGFHKLADLASQKPDRVIEKYTDLLDLLN